VIDTYRKGLDIAALVLGSIAVFALLFTLPLAILSFTKKVSGGGEGGFEMH